MKVKIGEKKKIVIRFVRKKLNFSINLKLDPHRYGISFNVQTKHKNYQAALFLFDFITLFIY